jgi:FkbM family methyltransferase
MIRDIARKFSRGMVLRRYLPREYGHHPIFVSPESALAYWRWDLKKVDPFLLSMVRELVRKDMQVWDIGANVGLFSFAAAALGAKVLAVEADTWLVNLLHRSAHLNGLPVSVLSAAVADTVGVAELHLSNEGRASNSLTGSGRSHPVVTVTLDSLLERFGVPDLLKIDIEGSECAALRGGSQLLRKQPAIFCEVSQNHDDVARILSEAGYKLYAARESDRQPISRPPRDTLALPTKAVQRNQHLVSPS